MGAIVSCGCGGPNRRKTKGLPSNCVDDAIANDAKGRESNEKKVLSHLDENIEDDLDLDANYQGISIGRRDYTQAELDRMHEEDNNRLFIILYGTIYDLTNFVANHPGGNIVLKMNNLRECGEAFNTIHSPRAVRISKRFLVGKLLPPAEVPQADADHPEKYVDKEYTREEIQKMIDEKRFILIIFGDVYDVTSFASKHPGGATALGRNIGKECGEIFKRIHSMTTRTFSRKFRIGRLKEEPFSKNSEPTAGATQLTGQTSITLARRRSSKRASMTIPVRMEGRLIKREETGTESVGYFTFSIPEKLQIPPAGYIKLFCDPTQGTGRYYTPYICEDSQFKVCVKRYQGGKGSNYLFDLPIDTPVYLEGPFPPAWNFDEDSYCIDNTIEPHKKVLLIAGGTGLIPLYSIARDLLKRELATVYLWISARTHAEVFLEKELAEMIAKYGRKFPGGTHIEVSVAISRSESTEQIKWASRTIFGRITEDIIAEHVDCVPDAAVLCGPPSFNTDMTNALIDCDICDVHRIHVM